MLAVLGAGVLLGGAAQAGDRLSVTRVSFNAGASHALAMVQGSRDGSGFSAAQLHLLNTMTGREWKASRQAQRESPSPQTLMASLLEAQKPALKQQGYASGLTSVPRFKRTFPVQAPTWQEGVGAGQTEQNSVKLWSRPVPVDVQVLPAQTPCPWRKMLPPGSVPARLILRVGGRQVAATAVPCAARYTLERVDVKGNRALFTLRAYTPGFEGPNAQPLFIATTFD
ncbi:DUF2259 domain-containing protein [Deinococcus fonticola]|uniref:DUF2259 domain-containing protein n=1 Tax=Deinococcus fonticola TaxID=2528713 RepID=UPI001074D113|nr:DUF2259 domain-containing protein [Deinococcus fonticola]